MYHLPMSPAKRPRLTARGAATRERIVAGAAALIHKRGRYRVGIPAPRDA